MPGGKEAPRELSRYEYSSFWQYEVSYACNSYSVMKTPANRIRILSLFPHFRAAMKKSRWRRGKKEHNFQIG